MFLFLDKEQESLKLMRQNNGVSSDVYYPVANLKSNTDDG